MNHKDLRIIEKQLADFIGWLAENIPYHQGTMYCDMKDYIANSGKLSFVINMRDNFLK